VRKGEKLCIICIRTCAAWTFGRSPLLIAATMTQGTPPLSEPPNLSGVGMSWCNLWTAICTLLAAGVGFDKVATLVTRVSKLRVPLPKFVVVHKDSEDDVQFLARVELEAEGIVGSYTRPEHDACITNLRNGGCLNWVFKLVEVAYGPRPEPGTEEFTEAF
jgi:hypothetical protein